jgi:hypothetical protein
MIAQVFRMGPPPAGAQQGSEEAQQFAQDAAKRQRDVDGCEGIFMMSDPSTGEGLAVTLWRDEAAMKAAAAYQEEEISSAKKLNPSMVVPAPTVYEVFAHA